MITETETAFLAVVRAFLTEEKAALEELAALTEKQWNHLFVMAAQHSLLSAVYDVVGKTPEFAGLPGELRGQVKTRRCRAFCSRFRVQRCFFPMKRSWSIWACSRW